MQSGKTKKKRGTTGGLCDAWRRRLQRRARAGSGSRLVLAMSRSKPFLVAAGGGGGRQQPLQRLVIISCLHWPLQGVPACNHHPSHQPMNNGQGRASLDHNLILWPKTQPKIGLISTTQSCTMSHVTHSRPKHRRTCSCCSVASLACVWSPLCLVRSLAAADPPTCTAFN